MKFIEAGATIELHGGLWGQTRICDLIPDNNVCEGSIVVSDNGAIDAQVIDMVERSFGLFERLVNDLGLSRRGRFARFRA